METWQSLILGLAGIGFISDIVLHFVLPSRKRKDYAETELAEYNAYAERCKAESKAALAYGK